MSYQVCTGHVGLFAVHCSIAGKAAFCLGRVSEARAAYRQAITRDSFKLPAWEGMAEVQMATGEFGEAHQTFEQLVCSLQHTVVHFAQKSRVHVSLQHWVVGHSTGGS